VMSVKVKNCVALGIMREEGVQIVVQFVAFVHRTLEMGPVNALSNLGR
jgi:hypothetical protein